MAIRSRYLDEWLETIPNTQCMAYVWSNYSDLTRLKTPNGGSVREIPEISGKSRLVKYYNLARYVPTFTF